MLHPEDNVQIAIAKYLRLMRFTFSSTNGGVFVNNKKTQGVLKAMGYRKGCSDLIVWIPNGSVCIEVKKPASHIWSQKTNRLIIDQPAGTQSDEQKLFEEEVKKISGHHYIVAKTVNDVVDYFKKNKIVPR